MNIDPDNPLASELRQEMAQSYFAACKKMVAAVEAFAAFDNSVAGSILNWAQIVCRKELLEQACERVHFVVIQREAMQLTWYEGFFDDYEIPDEVRKRLGVKRRE
jgi:hypothetical protein